MAEPISNPVRVFFLGSGNLGTAILDALRGDSRVTLVGLGSQEDKESGRKKIMTPTAFAKHAESRGLSVERLKKGQVNAPEFLARLRELQVELLLVVAFGQLLKSEVLSLALFGCLNVHASLLPRYRGACPINAAILNGDSATGVSFMRMDVGLDTGPVYQAVETAIGPSETTGQLEERLGRLAAEHAAEVIWRVAREGLSAVPQAPTAEPNVRKLKKTDAILRWTQSAQYLSNMVRAYQPWPKAFTFLPVRGEKLRVQVVEATVEAAGADVPRRPGLVLPSQTELRVVCGSGILRIHRLIPEGRKELKADDFLRGYPIDPQSVLE